MAVLRRVLATTSASAALLGVGMAGAAEATTVFTGAGKCLNSSCTRATYPFVAKPRHLQVAEAVGGTLTLGWHSWGKTKATATGSSWSEGASWHKTQRVSVTLWRPVHGHFTRMTIHLQDGGTSTQRQITGFGNTPEWV